MTQAGLICLQAIPIVNAALAVKESVEMFTPARNLAMSKCYQEISAPGWIKVLEKAETMSLGFPPRTTRTGCTAQRSGHVCVRVCVSFEQCRIARDYYCCCSSSGLSFEVRTKSFRVMSYSLAASATAARVIVGGAYRTALSFKKQSIVPLAVWRAVVCAKYSYAYIQPMPV